MKRHISVQVVLQSVAATVTEPYAARNASTVSRLRASAICQKAAFQSLFFREGALLACKLCLLPALWIGVGSRALCRKRLKLDLALQVGSCECATRLVGGVRGYRHKLA